MKKVIVNLTPHEIHLYRGDELVEKIKSSGIARVAVRSEKVGEIDGFPNQQKLLWGNHRFTRTTARCLLCSKRPCGAGGG